jgi:acyl carrier protein
MRVIRADEVKRFILSHLDIAFKENGLTEKEITDDFDIMKRGIIDSIGFIQLISAIEEQFGIEIDFEAMDTENLTVIGSISKYIEEFVKKATNDA